MLLYMQCALFNETFDSLEFLIHIFLQCNYLHFHLTTSITFFGRYSFLLNSEELYDPDTALDNSQGQQSDHGHVTHLIPLIPIKLIKMICFLQLGFLFSPVKSNVIQGKG